MDKDNSGCFLVSASVHAQGLIEEGEGVDLFGGWRLQMALDSVSLHASDSSPLVG